MSKKSSPQKKKRSFVRLDEMSCATWRPLTLNELRMLAPIKLKSGKISVSRELLSLLLGERDRLIYVAESAKWLFDIMVREDRIPAPDFLNPTAFEKALSVLRGSLASMEDDGLSDMTGIGAVADIVEGEQPAPTIQDACDTLAEMDFADESEPAAHDGSGNSRNQNDDF